MILPFLNLGFPNWVFTPRRSLIRVVTHLWLRATRRGYSRWRRLEEWRTAELLRCIVHIDPFDTPFVSSAPRVTASGTIHEWVLDELKETDDEP